MSMYRAAQMSEKYLWWVVVSLILQVWKRLGQGMADFWPSVLRSFSRLESASPMGAEQTLKLAQCFIQRHLDNTKTLRSLEVMMIYIDVLYAQVQGFSFQV